jgi:hypothetical protein
VSRTRLQPLLRGRVRIKFSSDGRYLFTQTVSGIYLLRRDPLSPIAYINAEHSYPARFSADSQELLIVSRDLTLARIRVRDGSLIENRQLPFRSCLGFELSPDAAAAACLDPHFDLLVRSLAAAGTVTPDALRSNQNFFPVSIGYESAFSSPFGYLLLDSMEPVANRGADFVAGVFSPDSKSFLTAYPGKALRIDVLSQKTSSLPGDVYKHLHKQDARFLGDDRLLSLDPEHDNQPAIFSATSGHLLATPAFTADVFSVATNSRYALLTRNEIPGVALFDLEKNTEIPIPANLGADVLGEELAILNDRGGLYVHHLGEVLPKAALSLQPDPFSTLTGAVLNADLTRFALTVDGQAAFYELPSGRRLSGSLQFSSAYFADPVTFYTLQPARRHVVPQVNRYDVKSSSSVAAWSPGKSVISLRSGGAALLAYFFDSPMGDAYPMVTPDGIPFRIRALDPATGKELWAHTFDRDPPLPFADPQGKNFVVGWNARTQSAESAARQFPAVRELLKHAKLSKQDTLFQSFDVRSGKPTGAALVQAGSGAVSYESAFAVGDTLFLVKDHVRVSLYSLTEGIIKGRVVGEIPSASVQANLFVVSDESGKLSFYDLKTTEKITQLLFPAAVAYTRFSEDGKRLFVLTRYQEAFVLDVEQIRKSGSGEDSP